MRFPNGYATLGLFLGAVLGILLYALTNQIFWFGLFMIGLIIGATIDNRRRQHRAR